MEKSYLGKADNCSTGNPPLEVALGQRKTHVNSYRCQTMHRGKVDPGVSELPRGNELSRDHVNRPLVASTGLSQRVHKENIDGHIFAMPQRLFQKLLFNPIRPGGAQRPGWQNSQLPIRNLLSYDAQTWWLLVFILETPFSHISAKLVNQGGCCCSFLIETSQKFWKWKIFPMLENCWNWHGGQFWVEKNDSGHKNSFF